MFRHDGRYYLLDYKSNWLGENGEAPTGGRSDAMTATTCSISSITWRYTAICAIVPL